MTQSTVGRPGSTRPDFPMDRGCPYHPPAGYDGLRESGPVAPVRLFDGRPAWAVTGFAEARALLTDPRLSSDRARPDFPVMVPRMSQSRLTALVGLDAPEHTRQRRMLIGAFTVQRTAALRPAILEVVTERIDAMLEAGGPLDLVPAFALPIPSTVICRLLGVPYDDHEFFERETARMLLATSSPQDAAAAAGALFGYFHDLVRARVAGEDAERPPDGLVDDLVRDQLATGALGVEDVASMAMFLLVAGHETTANMLALAVLALLEHPEQAALVGSGPEAFVAGAVEELLRFLSVADEIQRVAAADIEIGGVVIREGDAVYLPDAALNRDPAAFERPDELDVARGNRRHMAFGYGIHQCLGQNLARAELAVALRELFGRIPTLRLAVPLESLPVKSGGSVQGVFRLPVTW